jgi:hypothetical protein
MDITPEATSFLDCPVGAATTYVYRSLNDLGAIPGNERFELYFIDRDGKVLHQTLRNYFFRSLLMEPQRLSCFPSVQEKGEKAVLDFIQIYESWAASGKKEKPQLIV